MKSLPFLAVLTISLFVSLSSIQPVTSNAEPVNSKVWIIIKNQTSVEVVWSNLEGCTIVPTPETTLMGWMKIQSYALEYDGVPHAFTMRVFLFGNTTADNAYVGAFIISGDIQGAGGAFALGDFLFCIGIFSPTPPVP